MKGRRWLIAVLSGALALIWLAGCAEAPAPQAAPPAPDAWQDGNATWVGQMKQGLRTMSGELFDMRKPTASHASLPFGTRLEVASPATGQTARVVVIDRGGVEPGTDLVLSQAAAEKLGVADRHRFAVRYRVVP